MSLSPSARRGVRPSNKLWEAAKQSLLEMVCCQHFAYLPSHCLQSTSAKLQAVLESSAFLRNAAPLSSGSEPA